MYSASSFIVVKCSADNIPEKFELDISKLNVGETLTTSAIALPAGVKLADTEEVTVLTIAGQEAEKADDAPATEEKAE